MSSYPGFRWKNKPPVGHGLDLSHRIASGLRLAWFLNEGTGPYAADLSGWGHRGSVLSATTWAGGDRGPALSCPGSSSGTNGVTSATSVIPNPASNPLSLVARVRPTSTGSNAGILFVAGASSAAFGIELRSGNWKAEGYGGGTTPGIAGPAAVAGAWTHLALTTDGAGHNTLYVNGIAAGSSSTTPQSFTPISVQFGRFDGSFDPFPGQLDHGLVLNRALTAGEVAALAADPYQMFLAPATRRFFAPAGGAGASAATLAEAAQSAVAAYAIAQSESAAIGAVAQSATADYSAAQAGAAGLAEAAQAPTESIAAGAGTFATLAGAGQSAGAAYAIGQSEAVTLAESAQPAATESAAAQSESASIASVGQAPSGAIAVGQAATVAVAATAGQPAESLTAAQAGVSAISAVAQGGAESIPLSNTPPAGATQLAAVAQSSVESLTAAQAESAVLSAVARSPAGSLSAIQASSSLLAASAGPSAESLAITSGSSSSASVAAVGRSPVAAFVVTAFIPDPVPVVSAAARQATMSLTVGQGIAASLGMSAQPAASGYTLAGGSIVVVGPPGSGYFTGYLPGYFTPYFPGSGYTSPAGSVVLSSPPGPAPSGYFTGYFPGYFTQYFPGSGGVLRVAVATPPLAGTFPAAVRRALMGDAALAGMVGNRFWHRYVPPDSPRPYIVYAVINHLNEGVGGPHYIQTGQFQLVSYASPASAARLIADRATRLLSDRTVDLIWTNGRLMMFRAADPPSPDRPNLDAGGAKLQAETRTFDYMLSGRFNA